MDFADLEMRIEWTLLILRNVGLSTHTDLQLMKQITKKPVL